VHLSHILLNIGILECELYDRVTLMLFEFVASEWQSWNSYSNGCECSW